MSEWQLIETAPRGGETTTFIAWHRDRGACLCSWRDYPYDGALSATPLNYVSPFRKTERSVRPMSMHFTALNLDDFTHWMPVPGEPNPSAPDLPHPSAEANTESTS
jgi:hypothetical protein